MNINYDVFHSYFFLCCWFQTMKWQCRISDNFFLCTSLFPSLTVAGLLICISFTFSCHKSWHFRQEATFSISLLDAYQNAHGACEIAHVLLLTHFIGSNSHDVFCLIVFAKGYWKKAMQSSFSNTPFTVLRDALIFLYVHKAFLGFFYFFSQSTYNKINTLLTSGSWLSPVTSIRTCLLQQTEFYEWFQVCFSRPEILWKALPELQFYT